MQALVQFNLSVKAAFFYNYFPCHCETESDKFLQSCYSLRCPWSVSLSHMVWSSAELAIRNIRPHVQIDQIHD